MVVFGSKKRGSLKDNPIFKSSASTLQADFIRDQANLSRDQAQRQLKSLQNEQSVSMPLQFASKEDYVNKLLEILLTEAECERIKTESIAAKDISFVFEERLDIYSKLILKVPKVH